jgi:hypothetical protein
LRAEFLQVLQRVEFAVKQRIISEVLVGRSSERVRRTPGREMRGGALSLFPANRERTGKKFFLEPYTDEFRGEIVNRCADFYDIARSTHAQGQGRSREA